MFDVDAYLNRIAVPPVAVPNHNALGVIQLAHRRAIPFENIDVMLGREVRIDMEEVIGPIMDSIYKSSTGMVLYG